jgi:predicted Zn-dependent peptidase
MCNNVFEGGEFELERQVILEELRMELDNPWDVLRQAVARKAFTDHPYRYPVIGTPADVANLKLSTIRDHYEQFYVPGNATLVLVGDFDTQETMQQVNHLFGPLPPSEVSYSSTLSPDRSLGPTRLRIDHPTTIPRLIAGIPSPSIDDEDLFAFHLIDKLLTEGKLSRLFQRLIENERLTSMVTSEFCETQDPFLLFVRLDIREHASMASVEAAFLEELARLTQEEPATDEVQRAKKQCKTHFLNDLESTSDQAFNIGLYENLNRLDVLSKYCEHIDAVTPEEVVSTAKRYTVSPDSPH